MMELFLDRFKIFKDISMIEFQVVQDQRAWAIVNKLGTLIKEGAIVFIRFHNKKVSLSQTCGHGEIARDAADNKPWLITADFKNPGHHTRGGGFTMGTSHSNDPTLL